MTETVLYGIGLLLAVSVLVRVVPAFVPLPVSEGMAERIESILPVAVFINLAMYCAVSEISASWIPGLAGMLALVLLLPLIHRIGLIVVVVAASAVYLVAREYAPGIARMFGLA
jgi:hypothetical protein